MPKNTFRLPKNLEVMRLKNIYKPILDKMNDVSQQLKDNFYNLVLPSFAEPVLMKEISLSPRFLCLFKPCVEKQKSFSSKQKFIQHLTIIHDQELPHGGSFISPNDKSTKPGGFWCSKCGHHYCRRDHLQNHIKTSVHCREALVMDRNPLELKEIEYDSKQAIEFSKICKNKEFDFKHPEMLAIEWKQNDYSPQTTSVNRIRSLTKSFSMINISKSKKPLNRKSNSFDIFTSCNVQTTVTAFSNNIGGKRKLDNDDSNIKIKKEKKDQSDIEDEELLKTLLDFENNNKIHP